MKCIALFFISNSGSDPWSSRVGSKKDNDVTPRLTASPLSSPYGGRSEVNSK